MTESVVRTKAEEQDESTAKIAGGTPSELPPPERTVGRRRGQGWCWIRFAVLAALLLVAAGLRLDHLESRGMGHVESYTPGLRFPDKIAGPESRVTLRRSFTGPIFEEPHPPAWYVVMWPWSRLFGTDLVTIRLPSVLFGVGSVALIYQLGVLAHGWPTGLAAAALLTLNGHHLLFSQVARPTTMAVFLSILSTTLLLTVLRAGTLRRLFLGGYLAVTLLGMATLYYFWPILAAQMLWVALRTTREPSIKPLLRLQWLLVILGAPLVTLAIFQRVQSFLDGDSLSILVQFLEFGFLFEPDNFGVLSVQSYIPSAVQLSLPIVCTALIVLGLVRTRWQSATPVAAGLSMRCLSSRLSMRWLALATGLCVAVMLPEAIYFERSRPAGSFVLLLATCLIPPAILAGLALSSRAPVLERVAARIRPIARFPGDSVALIYVMAIVPVAIIAGVSLFIPFFASRHMLLYTPYLLIITSRGIVELFNLNRTLVFRVGFAAFVAGLLLVHVSSIQYSKDRLVTLVDYRGLASRWLPSLQPGDFILLKPSWAITPIFYYLDCGRYTCLGSEYAASVQRDHPARVWVLSTTGVTIPEPTLTETLIGYQRLEDVAAESINADLYAPVAP